MYLYFQATDYTVGHYAQQQRILTKRREQHAAAVSL